MAVAKKEYFISLDKFNRPAEVTGEKAEAILLARLILMNPGSNPLHPDMGIGIKQRYRFSMDKLPDLQREISDQINKYLPDFSNDLSTNIILTPDKILNIEIMTATTVYTLTMDTESVKGSTLSDAIS